MALAAVIGIPYSESAHYEALHLRGLASPASSI